MHDPQRSPSQRACTPSGRPDITMCRPRRHRRMAALSAGLCLAATLISGTTAAAATRAPRAAAIPSAQADHWGFFFGDHPPGNEDVRRVPTAIHLPGPVAEVGSSNSTEYALLTNGTLWAWGQGGDGELGNGQTLVMLSDGTLFAWGDDSFSQLGDGGTGMRPSPVWIRPPAGGQYAVLANGGATSYALTTTGDVYAWGANKAGEVGNGGTRTAVTPVRAESGATVVSSTAGNVVVASTAR